MNFAGGLESPDSLANSTTNNSGFDLSVWIVPIMAIVIFISNRPGVDWEKFIVLPAVLVFKYSFTLTSMLTLFKSVVPYRTRNEIHYICSDCGKTGTLKKLREEVSLLPYNEDEQGKNTEQITDVPENTTQDTEHHT